MKRLSVGVAVAGMTAAVAIGFGTPLNFAPSSGQTCPTLTQVDVTNSTSNVNTI